MLVRARAHSRNLRDGREALLPDVDISQCVYVVDTDSITVRDGIKAILVVKTKNDPAAIGWAPLETLDLDEAPYTGGPL